MLVRSIFLVPVLVGGTLLLLGALLAIYDRDWAPLQNAGYLAGITSLLFLLVHVAVAGLIPLLSPWRLSILVGSWIEVLVYLPLLALVIYSLKKSFPEMSPRSLKEIERKVNRVRKVLNEEEGVKDRVNSLEERLKEVAGDTGGLDSLDRRCSEMVEKLDSLDALLSEIDDKTPGDTAEKTAKEVSKQVSNIPKDTADRTVERVSERLSGMKQYEEGQNYQVKSMREFEAEGFDEVENHPSGSKNPDHILINGGQVVAAVEVRHSKITGSKTLKRSNFVTAFDYAKKKSVPLIIKWWNPETERLWLRVVGPGELQVEDVKDFKLTVPTWLWHSELEEAEKREMQKQLQEAKERIRELAEGK